VNQARQGHHNLVKQRVGSRRPEPSI